MNSQEIEKILEKYFAGDTSLEEEVILKNYFSQKDVSGHLQSLKHLFNYAADASKGEMPGDEFEQKILDGIQETKTRKLRTARKMYLYVASGVAAGILIIIGLFITFDSFLKPMTDTEIAYNKTRQALIFISAKFNTGLEPAGTLAEFDKGMKQLSKIKTFDKGVDEVSKVSKFYETQKKITK